MSTWVEMLCRIASVWSVPLHLGVVVLSGTLARRHSLVSRVSGIEAWRAGSYSIQGRKWLLVMKVMLLLVPVWFVVHVASEVHCGIRP